MHRTTLFIAQAGGEFGTFLLITMVLILVLIAGFAKCCSISRRPTTNTKCVMALGLLLLAILIARLAEVGEALIRLPFLDVANFISLGISLAAAVLAVIGLREYARNRGVYRQGKAQAIWTLALSVFGVALPILSLAQAKWNILRIERPRLTAKVLEFTNLNFKFFAPGDPWQDVEGDPLDLKPVLALRLARSDMHFAVVAQRATKAYYSEDQLEALATNTLNTSLESVRILSHGPMRLGSLNGVQLDVEAGHQGRALYLENRLFENKGWTYQLIAWAPKRHEEDVTKQAQFLAYRFQLLDYTPSQGRPSIELPPVIGVRRGPRAKILFAHQRRPEARGPDEFVFRYVEQKCGEPAQERRKNP